jgi:UDP-N-acetylmuramoylalanine--D-glutamate ligase
MPGRGVPGRADQKHPIAAHARAHGVPLDRDIELFALARPELPAHKVSGSPAPTASRPPPRWSTTSSDRGRADHHGRQYRPADPAQDPLPEGGVYVLELSSFQIDLTYSLDCESQCCCQTSRDHLDRTKLRGLAARKRGCLTCSPRTHESVGNDDLRSGENEQTPASRQ